MILASATCQLVRGGREVARLALGWWRKLVELPRDVCMRLSIIVVVNAIARAIHAANSSAPTYQLAHVGARLLEGFPVRGPIGMDDVACLCGGGHCTLRCRATERSF
jgi:hypothetical protein